MGNGWRNILGWGRQRYNKTELFKAVLDFFLFKNSRIRRTVLSYNQLVSCKKVAFLTELL